MSFLLLSLLPDSLVVVVVYCCTVLSKSGLYYQPSDAQPRVSTTGIRRVHRCRPLVSALSKEIGNVFLLWVDRRAVIYYSSQLHEEDSLYHFFQYYYSR